MLALALVAAPRGARAVQDQRGGDVADLAVTLTYAGEPAAVRSGDILLYMISAHNFGGAAARDVRIRQALPAGVFVSATGGGVLSGGAIEWPAITSFAVGATITLEVRIVATTCPATLTSEATVTSTAPRDPDLSNNRDSVDTPVECLPPLPDVEVIKTGPAAAGTLDTIHYRIVATNVGAGTADTVGLVDILPAAGTLLGWSGGAVLNGTYLVWPRTQLGPGESREFEVLWLAPPCPATLENTALVSASNDTHQANDRSTSSTVVNGTSCEERADVRIRKDGPTSIETPGPIHYELLVTNDGPSAATDLVVTDTLPPGATIVGRSEPEPRSVQRVEDPRMACSMRTGRDSSRLRTRSCSAKVAPSGTRSISARRRFARRSRSG